MRRREEKNDKTLLLILTHYIVLNNFIELDIHRIHERENIIKLEIVNEYFMFNSFKEA